MVTQRNMQVQYNKAESKYYIVHATFQIQTTRKINLKKPEY